MCGRTSLANVPEHLRIFLAGYGIPDVPPWYSPRYNIAPSQDQMLIVERDGRRQVRAMRWGLVPFWAKDPSIGNKLINARCETAATKPSYREAFARRRGLMVVDGYYEWRKNQTGPKTPFRIHRGDELPFTIAALWERWGSAGDELESCVVLTTAANEAMRLIHDRMPVIVGKDAADAWLNRETPATVIQEIMTNDISDLTAYPVSHYVNSPANDDDRCWLPSGT